MLEFCLLYYLLSSDGEAVTLYKVWSLHIYALFFKAFNKKTKLVLYWIILSKSNTSRFGSTVHRYYHLTLENILDHSLLLLVCFHFCFYFAIEKCIFYYCKFLCHKESLLTYNYFSIVFYPFKVPLICQLTNV